MTWELPIIQLPAVTTQILLRKSIEERYVFKGKSSHTAINKSIKRHTLAKLPFPIVFSSRYLPMWGSSEARERPWTREEDDMPDVRWCPPPELWWDDDDVVWWWWCDALCEPAGTVTWSWSRFSVTTTIFIDRVTFSKGFCRLVDCFDYLTSFLKTYFCCLL